MARGGRTTLDVSDVPSHLRSHTAPEVGEIRIPTGATMEDVERIVIAETMKASGYNKEKCAKTLGIGLRTLYRKIKQFDLQ
jgi:two-component system, NtrC family, response regulator HydG